MKNVPRRRLLVAVVLATAIAPVGAQQAPPANRPTTPWWKDEGVKKELSLTVDQVTRVDNIFQATLPQLRQQKAELDRLEEKLSQLIATGADEAIVVRHVDKVEATRADLVERLAMPERNGKRAKVVGRDGGDPCRW